LSQAIAAALKKGRFAKVPVIGCLPRQMVNVRMLELPSTDRDEITDMVDLQVGKQTPYSKDEIVFDYRVVGLGRTGYTRVMLNIVQRSVIRERFHVLEEAGVEVERMSTSSEGIFNWCVRALPKRSAVAVLDVDSSCSDLTVMVNGVLVFTKSIQVGANLLLKNFEQWKEKLSIEVRRLLEACQGELPGVKVGQLLVAGAGVNVKGLAKGLEADLGSSVEEIDSLKVAKKMPKKPSLGDSRYAAVSLTPLIGMALDPAGLQFNLVPDSVTLRKNLENRARHLTVLSMLVMTALVSTSMYAAVKMHLQTRRLGVLADNLSETTPRVNELKRMRDVIGVVNGRRDRTFTAANLFSVLHPLVPEGVLFDSIEFDVAKEKDQVRLDGVSKTNPAVRALVGNLEESPLFKDARQVQTKMEKKMYRFQVVCSVEK